MLEPASFKDLLRRVKRGDAQAAEDLIHEYEPEIRIIVKRKLSSELRREVDSIDICQSVLKDFFFRPASKEREFENPGRLLAYLAQMVQNKLTDKARAMKAGKRPKFVETPLDEVTPPVDSQTPSRVFDAAELKREIQRVLSPEAWEIYQRRAEGESWEAVGAACGLTPEVARKRWSKAMALLRERLGDEV